MKKFIYLIFIFSPFVLLFSQSKPIVQVDPVINLSDEVWLDAVCDAATDNVLFTLKFLGQFEVISDSIAKNETDKLINTKAIDQETFDTSSLKTRAESKGYDNILFGSCTIENGSYVITMNAYDLALDKITYSGSTDVESIFDTFEAVDEITYQTVEGFSGIHVTYGSLVLVPPDTGEPFSFTIDGIALPEGTFSVERMPAGVHELAVRQERPFGLYEAVHEIEVVEEIENEIDITLPNVVGEEIEIFRLADEYLMFTNFAEKSVISSNLNDLNDLLETQFFQEYRLGLILKYDKWITIMEREIPFSNEINNMKASHYIRSLWDSEMQKGVSNDIVSLSSQFLIELPVLNNQESIQQGLVSDNSYIIPIRTITVDGDSEDWEGILPIADPSGDSDRSLTLEGKGSDLIELKFAIDSNNLYVMFKTADEVYKLDRLAQKLNLFSGNNNFYFASHLDWETPIYSAVTIDSGSNEKSSEWDFMRKQVKYKTGAVLEWAIPLLPLIKSNIFLPTMKFFPSIAYDLPEDGRHQELDWIGSWKGEQYITFPLVELLVKKDEI